MTSSFIRGVYGVAAHGYFVPTMHRATPGTRTLPSFSNALTFAMACCPNPLPRRFVDLLKRRNCERDVLADHLPILRGRSRHEFDVDVPLGNVAQPRALVQGTDISRGRAPEHVRPVRVGWRHHRLGRDRLHGDRRPRVFLGLDPYRRAETSARLEHARELGRRLGHVGEEHVPETHGDAVECGVVERQIIGAAHLRLDVGDPLRLGSSRGDVQHLRDEVGQHDASLRRQSRDAQTRLTRARRRCRDAADLQRCRDARSSRRRPGPADP